MVPIRFLFLSFLSLLSNTLIPLSNAKAQSFSPSIYEILKAHGLPMGLLPKGITDFDVDTNGHFQVYLDQACNAKFESQLHYDRNVSGTLSFGQIAGLSGVSAQELFLWFPVKGIRVDIPSSGLIYFDVGVVFKQFSLSLFETPPDCMELATTNLLLNPTQQEVGQVFKSQSRKLRYELGQEDFARDVV
ncbi:uncharacterized protein LOC115960343 isoform X2 [Quercus lobata]|uniref:Uncharacterized protein n=1 Tax=Quercus lobata TaxID=97700 RepID=A0A7N2RB95_QUELO|nr:uncharacterized protein LOC115960343 isoform X2 [Quercus lobata]